MANNAYFRWEPLDATDEEMGDCKVVDWAANFLADPGEKPFFLAVGLFRPHMPWHVPRPYFDRHPLNEVLLPATKQDDLDDLPESGRLMAVAKRKGVDLHTEIVQSGQWQKAVQAYLACIEFSDSMLGRLMDAFDKSPAREDTIIVLWSDHGMHLGEKNHWTKFALWERATRVPMIIVAPGVTAENQRSSAVVSLLDLYPTLVELCGLPKPDGLEGTSLLPQLKNPKLARTQPAIMTQGRNNHAVRDGQFRYIRYSDGGEELYDHKSDPNEWTNLASVPEFDLVKQKLAEWFPKHNKVAGK